MNFTALGYCSMDYLCRIPKIPLDSKVEISEWQLQGGGPAGSAAVAAARLGWQSRMLTSVGDDDWGKQILVDFQAEQVSTDAIKVRSNCASPVAFCWITPDGSRSVAWSHNHLPSLTATEVPANLAESVDILHLDGHHPEAAVAAAEMMRNGRQGIISLDAGTWTPAMAHLMPIADILIASEEFALKLTKQSDELAILTALQSLAPLAEVIGATRGNRGSIFLEYGEVLEVPIFAAEVVDSTGAGDCFHAAFAVRYYETRELRKSARFASAAAALKCGKPGARAGMPRRLEVNQFLLEGNQNG